MGKSSHGCWTCRLRRKKCDEQRPICKECHTLQISTTCSYGHRPAWMDGGARQEAMAEQIKQEIKRQAPYRHRRKVEAVVDLALQTPSASEPALSHQSETPSSPAAHDLGASSVDTEEVCRQVLRMRPFAQADSVLLVFYLERILPFLFPFYRPAPLQGSRAWILDLVISSPVLRQAILCQSSYFFASAHAVSITTNSQMWEALLEQARDAFNILRGSIQVVGSVEQNDGLLGSVRTMAAIVQLQRFETAISCFDNCRAHLNAALSVFRKIINVVGAASLASSSGTFEILLSLFGAPTWILSTQTKVPSSEQAAFRFSLAMLVFDDIMASTALREPPRLAEFHYSLLDSREAMGDGPCIDLETIVGCQNWVLQQIGEIAALDAWQKTCQDAGTLDITELVNHMTTIKMTLEVHLSQLAKTNLESLSPRNNNSTPLEDAFTADEFGMQPETMRQQGVLVTQIWAHSAFLYLSIVASGWQPANTDVRRHVAEALDLLMQHGLPPAVLRSMAWPICVISCLAESVQHDRIRDMVDSLQPVSRFTTVHRGFDVSEKVRRDRAQGCAGDFASYFRDNDTLVLLV